MASVLQVNEIKDSGGNNTGITVADTTANVTVNNLVGGTITSAVNFPGLLWVCIAMDSLHI